MSQETIGRLAIVAVLAAARGLTRIRLGHDVLTTTVCMGPAGAAYTDVGYPGRKALAGGERTIQKGLLARGLIAVIGFLRRLVRRLRAKAKDSGRG